MSDAGVGTEAADGPPDTGFWLWVAVGAGAALAASVAIGRALQVPMPF